MIIIKYGENAYLQINKVKIIYLDLYLFLSLSFLTLGTQHTLSLFLSLSLHAQHESRIKKWQI